MSIIQGRPMLASPIIFYYGVSVIGTFKSGIYWNFHEAAAEDGFGLRVY